MAAGRLHHGNAESQQPLGHVLDRRMAVDLVVVLQRLHQPDGDSLEIASGQTAVGREPLPHDQEVAETFRPLIVTADQKAADVGKPVLLAAHGGAIGQREHLLSDLEQRAALIPLLPFSDKVRVLGEPAGVDDEGNPVLREQSLDRTKVVHRHRLAATGVIGHGHHGKWDLVGTVLLDTASEPLDIHVALER